MSKESSNSIAMWMVGLMHLLGLAAILKYSAVELGVWWLVLIATVWLSLVTVGLYILTLGNDND